MTASATKKTPAMQFLSQEDAGWSIYTGLKQGSSLIKGDKFGKVKYSPNGELIMGLKDNEVRLYETANGKSFALDHKDVREASFSPGGGYVISYSPWSKGINNLTYWRIKKGQTKMVKTMSVDGWYPAELPIKWSKDESLAARLCKNRTIEFLDGNDINKVIGKYDQGDNYYFSISPNGGMMVTFAKRRGGQSICTLMEVKIGADPQTKVLQRRASQGADSCEFRWNCLSSHVICSVKQEAGTNTRTQSYQAMKAGFLMSREDTMVLSTMNEKMQDAQFHPNGREVVVINQFPFQATAYSITGKTVHKFGKIAVNTISFNPRGRYLLLGGFKNISGNMFFFDYKDKKMLGTGKYQGTRIAEWSMDGRYLLVARLWEFRKVDNGFCIFSPNGTEILKKDMEHLYSAMMRPYPGPATDFPDFDVTARKGNFSASQPSGKPTKRYVPPGMRNSPAAQLQGRPQRGQVGADGRYRSNATLSGINAQAKAEHKRKKNEEKRKRKAAQKRQAAEEKSQPQKMKASNMGQAAAYTNQSQSTTVDPKKEAKKINKKLRQIDQLKQKIAEGQTLKPEQMAKVKSEADLRAQLKKLNVS